SEGDGGTCHLRCLRAGPAARFSPRQRQSEANRNGDSNALPDAVTGGEQTVIDNVWHKRAANDDWFQPRIYSLSGSIASPRSTDSGRKDKPLHDPGRI